MKHKTVIIEPNAEVAKTLAGLLTDHGPAVVFASLMGIFDSISRDPEVSHKDREIHALVLTGLKRIFYDQGAFPMSSPVDC